MLFHQKRLSNFDKQDGQPMLFQKYDFLISRTSIGAMTPSCVRYFTWCASEAHNELVTSAGMATIRYSAAHLLCECKIRRGHAFQSARGMSLFSVAPAMHALRWHGSDFMFKDATAMQIQRLRGHVCCILTDSLAMDIENTIKKH